MSYITFKTTAFWYVMACSLVVNANISEEPGNPIFWYLEDICFNKNCIFYKTLSPHNISGSYANSLILASIFFCPSYHLSALHILALEEDSVC
jgi:hypothetical protein